MGGAALAASLVAAPMATAQEGALHYRTCPAQSDNLFSYGGYVFTFCFDAISLPSGGGHARFHGKLVASSPAPHAAETLTGFQCVNPAVPPPALPTTTNTRFTVTPSGVVNGQCFFD
ncbi:hypothetical protein BOX37_13345 [Nocardia mangyaensis]|uniref:Uncharacterized protein n=2 Tax=Nocardia mangyaensis TaxID=2213200 RepID=A0A1J0VRV8_9NOCA|nr:hypothetical protein BOX37_13345 [Nocardia mangyaensis]